VKEQSKKVTGGSVTKSWINSDLPLEVATFETSTSDAADKYQQLTADEWIGALHGVEVRDKNQQITLRPFFAIGVFLLLMLQNLGIWFIVVWALNKGQLHQLELIFSTLIGGSLVQSYYILRFITEKVFSDIDYGNGQGAEDKKQ